METLRYSANRFTSEEDIYFSPVQYSKFKFGCKNAAREFGDVLAKGFMFSDELKKLMEEHPEKRFVVLSSPYVHIPTATFAMKDYFIRTFNAFLISKGRDPLMECKVYRKSSYKSDYGNMSKEERMNIMVNDNFYVDREFLKGKISLFMDDIRITGAHEFRMKKMLDSLDMNDFPHCFLYYAQLNSENAHPSIEDYLNHFFVKDLISLDKIIKNEEYIINTRIVKYILNAPHEECKTFCLYQKHSFLHTVYHYALGNSYHKIPDYQENLSFIKNLLRDR